MLEMKILNLHTISITRSSSTKIFCKHSLMWLLSYLSHRWWVGIWAMLKKLKMKWWNAGRDEEKVYSTLTKSGLIFTVNFWINYTIWAKYKNIDSGWVELKWNHHNSKMFVCLFAAVGGNFPMLQKQQQTLSVCCCFDIKIWGWK